MNKNQLLFTLLLAFAVLSGFIVKKYTTEKAVTTLNKGDKAIDLSYKNPEGETITLFSLKKKIVLLDFWASWCGPCRRSNPGVVRLYNQYKDAKFKDAKGFTVYSVSLDRNKQAWINAIKRDKLTWSNHVSDLKGWQAAGAAQYGVRSIPTTYLIDENGIIIGKNLSHHDLEMELNKRLKNL